MDRRIETFVFDTGAAAATKLIQKDACEVWWLEFSVETVGTRAVIKIYDGFDAGGKLRYQCEAGYAQIHSFTPPIPCDQGITVVTDNQIASYVLGYRPKSWPLSKG